MFVLVAVSMFAMCAVAGFAVDTATWYQAHRKQQAIADAASLAAVRNLPGNQAQATSDAQAYATKNSGSVPAGNISYSSKYISGDSVTVKSSTTVPAYFLKVIGVNSATATATSTATAENLATANAAMPFGVINTQAQLTGAGCPCYGVSTQLTVGKVGPGGFGLVNIDSSSGPANPGTIASWIKNGCSCSTAAPRWLYGSPGARFNSFQVKSAMASAVGKTMLFPVYDTTQGNGANLQYHIVGWASFTMTSYNLQGSSGYIAGYFVKADWSGAGTSSTANYFGATTSVLTG